MATKITAVILAILALASAGTIGVAFYNDPTFFDSKPCPACMNRNQPAAAEPSCCSDGESCCDADKAACDKKP